MTERQILLEKRKDLIAFGCRTGHFDTNKIEALDYAISVLNNYAARGTNDYPLTATFW